MKCPECGKECLLLKTNRLTATLPPKHGLQNWCGDHGWQGEIEWHVFEHQRDYKAEWKRLNGIS